MNWKLAALALAAVTAYVVFVRKPVPAPAGTTGTAVEAGDPRGTVAHAIAVVSRGAKSVSEEGKRAILGEAKAEQREVEKKQRKGG